MAVKICIYHTGTRQREMEATLFLSKERFEKVDLLHGISDCVFQFHGIKHRTRKLFLASSTGTTGATGAATAHHVPSPMSLLSAM
jgi:hypothetical protein